MRTSGLCSGSRLGTSAFASSALLSARLPNTDTSNSRRPRLASALHTRGRQHQHGQNGVQQQQRRAEENAGACVGLLAGAHSRMDCVVSTVAFW